MKIEITKNRIMVAVVILCLLVAAWFYGSNYAEKATTPENKPASMMKSSGDADSSKQMKTKQKVITPQAISDDSSGNTSGSAISQRVTDPETGQGQYLTDSVPPGKPLPVEAQNAEIIDTPHTCTLSVVCTTILNNMNSFNQDKLEVLPADGIIFPATKVVFYEGETVLNVLQREMKKAGVQMEFKATPIYNSNYIEGIKNIYELDCGELSGWMYKVDSWFPNYGCARYQLKEGDVIEWVYTCDLGRDVGGYTGNRGGI